MSTPFDNVGFSNPYSSAGATRVPTSAPMTQQKPVQHSTGADTFTPSSGVDRDALKAELLEEMKQSSTKDAELKKQIKEELRQEIENEKKLEEKKKQPGLIGKFKRFIGTMKKAGVTIGEYAKGTFKGIVSGGLIGATGFGILTGVSQFLNSRNTEQSSTLLKKVLKSPRTAKIAAAAGLAVGLGVQLWNASLNANEKRALIDHRYENTPVNAGKK